MKARTFEEWASINRPQQQPEANEAWDAAQDAMFEHADGELPLAVRVPPVEEWPHNASAIAFPFIDKYTNLLDKSARDFLARPAPKWVPKEGDALLFSYDDRAMAGFIHGGKLYALGFMCADWLTTKKYAPFDASAIGKPWSEI